MCEEVGYDISDSVNRKEYIENQDFERINRLYLVRNVSERYKFKTMTTGEIKHIKWIPLSDAIPKLLPKTAFAKPSIPLTREVHKTLRYEHICNKNSTFYSVNEDWKVLFSMYHFKITNNSDLDDCH